MLEFPPTMEFTFGIVIGAVIFRLFFHGQKIYTGVWIVHGVFIFCRYFPKSGILIFSIFFQIRKFRFFEKSQFFGFFSQNRKLKMWQKAQATKSGDGPIWSTGWVGPKFRESGGILVSIFYRLWLQSLFCTGYLAQHMRRPHWLRCFPPNCVSFLFFSPKIATVQVGPPMRKLHQ